ncbi:MAG: CocE/NonD family hydrolase, partial [Actinomycetota bacterium]
MVRHFTLRTSAVLVALALVAVACTADEQDQSAPSAPDDAAQDEAPSQDDAADEGADAEGPAADLQQVPVTARPGPFQLSIDQVPDGVGPDATVEVVDDDGATVGSGTFAETGTALIRNLTPGDVQLVVVDGDRRLDGGRHTIPGEEPPAAPPPVAELSAGYHYLTTRDGTTLSAFVSLPGSATDGPYPTLVEYSGYSPSDPTAGDDPYRLLIPTLGYALVQVNVRGTGCSGGSFDAFERIQSLDGYDVIEAVAAQPWAGKVGMFGVSYPGIMQLHVASTRPPSLAAIAPLSPLGRVDSVLYPGGIFNNGFGEEWTDQVGSRAQAEGQPWAADRVLRGDQTCIENQRFRAHNPDLVEVIRANPFRNELSRSRSAETYAADIAVPTFIAGAWQDEQTGGRWPTLLDELAEAPVLRAVLYNGLHIDAISADMLVKLIGFLNLYLADRPADVPTVARVLIEVGLSGFFGDGLRLPAGDYDGLTVAEGRARFEADPPITVLFEQGAEAPNLPVPAFRERFEAWPPPQTAATTLHLSPTVDGLGLSPEPATGTATATFTTRPAEGQIATIGDLGTIWSAEPDWDWPAPTEGAAVRAVTDPLTDDLVLVGNLSADLWVSVEDGTDADLEVT